eukprot:2107240-Pyramimonas_sp.AAC.1
MAVSVRALQEWSQCSRCDEPFRACECPWMRWARFHQEWRWWCEVCQKHCGGKAHLMSNEHYQEAAKQKGHGWPDPRCYTQAGNLWARTRGGTRDCTTNLEIERRVARVGTPLSGRGRGPRAPTGLDVPG